MDDMTERFQETSALDLNALRVHLAGGPPPLFATVSGAHLYGFPSPDSDVDLRGAFVAPLRDVVGLRPFDETRTVSGVHQGACGDVELDWVAHDILKFCRLMTRKNGYVLEQLYSPLVVHGSVWHDELREIAGGCVVRHLHHHYRGFFLNQRKMLAKKPTVKALLYAYRVLLTGIHVLETGRIEAHLPSLLGERPVDDVAELIERKKSGTEKEHLDDGELALHEERLDTLEATMNEAFLVSRLPDDPTTFDALNDFVVRARLELGAVELGDAH